MHNNKCNIYFTPCELDCETLHHQHVNAGQIQEEGRITTGHTMSPVARGQMHIH